MTATQVLVKQVNSRAAGQRCRAPGQAGRNSPPKGAPAVNAQVANISKTHRVTSVVWVGEAALQFLITEHLQEN